jgi:hypothetical protein
LIVAMTDIPLHTALWRANHEFTQRLALSRSRLTLLYHTLDARGGLGGKARVLLESLDGVLTACYEAHTAWRYAYFYEAPDGQRPVQADDAAITAYHAFAAFLADHRSRYLPLFDALVQATPPAAAVRSAAGGDLWALLLEALSALCSIDAAA